MDLVKIDGIKILGCDLYIEEDKKEIMPLMKDILNSLLSQYGCAMEIVNGNNQRTA